MNIVNFSSLKSWFSCLDCCTDGSNSAEMKLEATRPHPSEESASELCDALSKSISCTFLLATAGLRDAAIKENTAISKRAATLILSSTVAFFTVPLAVIEGVARRAIGWTLSLLNRILPCGNETLESVNKTYFDEAIRNHAIFAFTAFEYTFGIFEPKTLLRDPEKIQNNSVILNILDVG
jgi:hypothetical protein